MEVSWAVWVVGITVTFGIAEWWAIHTNRATLSRTVWDFSRAWPPLPFVAGFLAGFLACHFWWGGIVCFNQ